MNFNLPSWLPRDKLQHIVMGILCVIGMVIAAWIYVHLSLGFSVAFATTAFGSFYELQQKQRGEGTPDIYDAIATASPGYLFLIIEQSLKHFH